MVLVLLLKLTKLKLIKEYITKIVLLKDNSYLVAMGEIIIYCPENNNFWRAYVRLLKENYIYKKINHKTNCVDSTARMHTQNIQGLAMFSRESYFVIIKFLNLIGVCF